MKILLTCSYYLPYISGLTIYAANLALGLLKSGADIEVLTTKDKKDLVGFEVVDGIKIYRTPFLFQLNKGHIMPLYWLYALRRVKENQIIIINLPQFEGLVVACLAKIFRKKLYCIYQCDVRLPAGFLNRVVECLLNLSNFFSLLLAKVIITLSEDYAASSRIVCWFKEKVISIYPPIPRPKINQLLRKEYQNLLPSGRQYVIGMAARMASEKGLEYLFGAIPFLKKKLGDNFQILFAGPKPVGEDKYQAEITPLINKYSKYLKFIGAVPLGKMGSFYSLLDVLVLPSVNSTEAFGMVQVEAMMMGVPVVASDLPGVRIPIKKTGMGVLVTPRNSQELALGLMQVLKNKTMYIKKRAQINQEFSFRRTIKNYQQLLAS